MRGGALRTAALSSLLSLSLAFATGAQTTETERAAGATLRALDKVSGDVTDVTLANGGQTEIDRLTVRLSDCRFPVGNPQGDAFAWVEVSDATGVLFDGWMIASSPALHALDHPRFDVWVLRCSNS